jgi:hypothetical protein
MPHNGKLLAWIEPREDDRFVAAFVGSAAGTTAERAPATRLRGCAAHRTKPGIGSRRKPPPLASRSNGLHGASD